VTGMPHTAGLVARKKRGPAVADAAAVKRLRNAGLYTFFPLSGQPDCLHFFLLLFSIPLCVTNTSELCMWYESTNNVYGTSNNPYDLRRIVGGSSGGEAALIAAAGVPCGLGSDIGGSIRMPAFFNGIWGLKPSGGVVPNEGQHPLAHGEALRYMTSGPLCRYAEDLWPMFKILADPFFEKQSTSQQTFPEPSTVDLASVEFVSITEIDNLVVQSVSDDLKQAQRKVEAFLKESSGAKEKKLKKGQLKNLSHAPDIWSSMLSSAGGKSFRFFFIFHLSFGSLLVEKLDFITLLV